jgi:RNA polymerase subunit RPABC4/transcription elongation factor Spt4
MKCKYCNGEIEQDSQFCPHCGKNLTKFKKCIKCGELLDKGTAFCPYCGTEQPHEEKAKVKKRGTKTKMWLFIIPLIILIILMIGVGAWYLLSGRFSFGEKTDKSTVQMVDSSAIESVSALNTEQNTEAMKAFLEDFYGRMDVMGQIDEKLIKKSLTPKALRILKEKGNEYITNDDGGGGQLSSYKVTHVKENLFEVCVVMYGMGTYFDHKVILGVVKEGNQFKIDTITKLS